MKLALAGAATMPNTTNAQRAITLWIFMAFLLNFDNQKWRLDYAG
jgi:hypothetical protein